ncbi:MAG: DNA processing protein [Candidatus Deianiraeaceae bacterium]|jgi:DNA processing protein
MSIIRCQTLESDVHRKLMDFLCNASEITIEETICWVRLWKLWGKITPHIANFTCIFKTLDFAVKSPKMSSSVLSIAEAQKFLDEAKSCGAEILTPRHKDYPNTLKQIPDFPLVLCAKGNIEILKKPMFAIVGSRSASAEALHISHNFAHDLAKLGFSIVSGFANGIDTSACKGAIKYGTIQVLGSGLKDPYPKTNIKLMEEVINGGGLFISEFPPSCPARPNNFPMRNRIITGLSSGVLIGQANRRNGISGTLVTLRIAISQGKEVFACPGSILDERCNISNNLLKNGTAHFATCTQDITNILQPSSGKKLTVRPKSEKKQKTLECIVNKDSDKNASLPLLIEENEDDVSLIKNTISTIPISVNDITHITEINIIRVKEILTELELEGVVSMNHLGKYARHFV